MSKIEIGSNLKVVLIIAIIGLVMIAQAIFN
jgi:hypothetical protein